jgi:NAD-dependent SIR2 family protein deacetylase
MASAELREALRRLAEMNERAEWLEAQVVALRGRLQAMRCEECERFWIDTDERWQLHRVDLDEFALYCPECSEREVSDA